MNLSPDQIHAGLLFLGYWAALGIMACAIWCVLRLADKRLAKLMEDVK